MAPISQDKRIASLQTPLGDDVLAVSRFDGGEGLSELFEYRIEAVSESDPASLNFDDAIGQHCSLAILNYSGQERVFDGILVEAQHLGKREGQYVYRLVLKPWLWLLSRTTNCRPFSNMSVPDIIKQVFGDAGFSDFDFKLQESYPTLEYCVQYRETDLAFVSRLMEQNGIYYFHRHEHGKHTAVFADTKSSHEPIPGLETILYVPIVEGSRPNQDHLYRVHMQRRFRTGKVALNDYDWKKPNKSLLVDASGTERYTHASMEHYDYPGQYVEQGDGEKFARVRLEAEQALDQRRNAQGDAVGIYPGGLFTLDRHPQGSENIQFLVVRANHQFVSQLYRSGANEEGPGESYYGTYELLPADRVFRAPLLTEKPIVHGPQTAKVVGKKGEEIDVDEHGRITVQFYWDRDKTPSCRVRVAQMWADKNWGSIFIPRVDQEVIVEHLEGDPDRPLVVGTVYNGDNKTPYSLPGEKNLGGIKSNSTKGGGGYNEWVFDDTKGSELIRGHGQKDLEFKILNDEKWDIGVNSDTKVGETLTIEAGMKIEFKVGKNKIVIDGTGVTIKGVAQIGVESPLTTVKGTGIMTVEGGLVKIN